MTIPEPIGVFIDPEKPEEFYCLAMDDLNLSNDSIDQIVGITIEDCKQLGSMAAKFHAAFWEHPLLKNDIVCKVAQGDTCETESFSCAPVWFGWIISDGIYGGGERHENDTITHGYCKGVPDAAAVFFEGWAVAAMTTV